MTVTTKRWYAFRAYNAETRYGFGTIEEASRYEDVLNEGRSINHYLAVALSDIEIAADGLESRDDAVNLDSPRTPASADPRLRPGRGER